MAGAILCVFFLRTPRKIVRVRVQFIPVEVPNLMSNGRLLREEMFGYKAMNCAVLPLSVDDYPNAWVAIFIQDLGQLALAVSAPV
nr:hypothetical protein [Mesorhizobium sp. CA8]